MHHYTYAELPEYPVCLLVPRIDKDKIRAAYFETSGVDAEDVLVLDLYQAEGKKKTSAKEMKKYITEALQGILDDAKVRYILCTDSDYFKTLTGVAKVDVNLGYVLDSKFGSQKVIYLPSYRQIFYDPDAVKTKIARAMKALVDHATEQYKAPGHGIIEFAAYPQTDDEIEMWLNKLIEMDKPLSIDIEAFSLKHWSSGIGTISFAWSKSEGIAFPVDYVAIEGATEAPYGNQVRNERRRELLRSFFASLVQKAVYHNIAFDVYILIYQLYMQNICDTQNLLHGLGVLLKNWDCTKLISYLATNSCAGNELSLKAQAQEFAGNYGQTDIHDIRRIPLPELLEYNLIDCLATWHVHEKHYDTMVQDDQLNIYQTLFQPATVDVIQMQLTGLPVNMEQVAIARKEMQTDMDKALTTMRGSSIIQRYTYRLNEKWVDKRNKELKVKRVGLVDAKETFNPNSSVQLQDLLYEHLQLPVIERTKTGLPSTDGDTIKALGNHTVDPYIQEFLNALVDYKAVDKILGTFIPALENAQKGPDGWHYMFGYFNLGGTVSGRLSSSDPNMQNTPATGTKYAKAFKSCIEAPRGWLYVGLDFASLEDKISAVTTKDPNKIKVYTDGYDGHSLRSFAYFGEQMPDIEDTVVSINSIQKKYKDLRFESKAPTFALTYQGTYVTLMRNCGFSEEKAKMVEQRYHDLYKVSDDWVQMKLDGAARDGYITAAFGLRVRTPLLAQVIRGNSRTPREAEAEGRTAGNALGQSWCLLNTRAAIEFMGKVRESEFNLTIRPCAHIHDAQYYLVRDNIETLMFINEHLVQAVQWQNHPDIMDDQVKLGGEVSIFYPNWANEIVVPNGVTEAGLLEVVQSAMS